MREGKRFALGQIGLDALFVEFGLFFVRGQDHDDVRDFRSLFRRHDFQAGCFGLRPGLAALIQADDDFHSAFMQVERMRVALAAIADDGDRFAFKDLDVAVGLVVYFCHC